MASKVSMVIVSRNSNGETENTTVSNVNPALFATTDAAVLQASFEFVDTAARALFAMSNNTYVDTTITRSDSVNEQLED